MVQQQTNWSWEGLKGLVPHNKDMWTNIKDIVDIRMTLFFMLLVPLFVFIPKKKEI